MRIHFCFRIRWQHYQVASPLTHYKVCIVMSRYSLEKEQHRTDLSISEALYAVEQIKLSSLTELAHFHNPPQAVKNLMELIGIFLRPDILPNKMSWGEARKLLKQPQLLRNLLEYDKDSITTEQLTHATSYMTHQDMEPGRMKRISLVAAELLMWGKAMYLYGQNKHQTTSN